MRQPRGAGTAVCDCFHPVDSLLVTIGQGAANDKRVAAQSASRLCLRVPQARPRLPVGKIRLILPERKKKRGRSPVLYIISVKTGQCSRRGAASSSSEPNRSSNIKASGSLPWLHR